MKLSDLKINCAGRITAVNCDSDYLKRLNALGIKKGVKVKVLRFSVFNKSILIFAESVRIILRRDIASGIEIERF